MRTIACALICAAMWLAAAPAKATYHIMVIDQAFLGFEQASDAQYVMLRIELGAQTFVHGQSLPTADALGTSAGNFAAFCPNAVSCDFPKVSPACAPPNACVSAIQSNDHRILVVTPRAQGLFCVTPDLLATGTLPYPDGRVCFGDTGSFGESCTVAGAVDCVAYGNFPASQNGIFGNPAPSPALGDALIGTPARQAQCHTAPFDTLSATAVCVGGSKANSACTLPADCPNGACVACPADGCRALLDNALGFGIGVPAPENFHGDFGGAGLAGDPEGTGQLEAENVGAEASILFEGNRLDASGRLTRCALPAAQRGADANLDTQVTAADVAATIQIVVSGGQAPAAKI